MAERPTPYSIAVCTLIAEHSDPSSSIHKKLQKSTGGDIHSNNVNNDHNNGAKNGLLPINIEEHLSKVIKFLVIQHDDSMALCNLLDMISGNCGQFSHAADILLDFLNESCESIDALVDLFTALRSTVSQGMIDGDSAHGIYVRKRCLGFDKLTFGSVGRFWESFCAYVYDANEWRQQTQNEMNVDDNPSLSLNKDSSDSITMKGDSMLIDESIHISPTYKGHGERERKRLSQLHKQEYSNIHDITHWPLAPRQISRKLFQKCLNLHKEIGFLSYEAMEAQIQEILRENPELTLAHFLRFLNDAMHGERVGALESFHRYFDYAMIQERKYRLLNSNLPNDNIHTNNDNPNHRDNNDNNDNYHATSGNVVQYSAIILSSLFHTFANDELAFMATKEAIRIAQQTGDGACLAYALGWLHASGGNSRNTNFSSFIVSSNGLHVPARASSRAARYNIRSLVAGSSLMRANQISMGGENEVSIGGMRYSICFIPAQTWETISTASTEGALANTIGITAYRYDIPTQIPNHANSYETMTTFAQQLMSGAGLWQCMGHSALASTSFQTTMRCYQPYLSSDESSLVAREISYSALYGAGSEKSYFNKESSGAQSLCSSLEQLRLTVPALQPTSLYQNSLQKLRKVWADKSKASGVKWCHSVIMLLHESSIQKFNLQKAHALNTLLHSCAPLVSREFVKLTVELLGQTILLFCRQRRWELAKNIISEKIIPICEVNRLRYYHAYYLLQLSIIHFDSSPYDPIRALTPILLCLSLSEKYSIDGIHAAALSLLARVHFELGNWSLAKSILSAAMSTIIQNAHVCFQGETYLCMAKCTLSEAKELDKQFLSTATRSNVSMNRRKNNLLKAALSQLQKSQISFEKAVDVIRLREVYYLLAQCHALLSGHASRRNMAAKRFQEMNRIKLQSNMPSWYDAIDIIKGSCDCE